MISIDYITIFIAINKEYGTDELIKRIKNILNIDLSVLLYKEKSFNIIVRKPLKLCIYKLNGVTQIVYPISTNQSYVGQRIIVVLRSKTRRTWNIGNGLSKNMALLVGCINLD